MRRFGDQGVEAATSSDASIVNRRRGKNTETNDMDISIYPHSAYRTVPIEHQVNDDIIARRDVKEMCEINTRAVHVRQLIDRKKKQPG